MKIKVREVKLMNNQVSVMLDIHSKGKRYQKVSGIRYALNPRNAVERQDKKEKKEALKKMVAKLELDAIYKDNFLEKDYQLDKKFFEYAQEFIERKAPHSETRAYTAVINKLELFTGNKKLLCCEIDEDFLFDFRDFLDGELNGVTPYNYFKKLRRIIKEATVSKYFKVNPAENIINYKGKSIEKETLTTEEIWLLTETECGNEEVKNAFLFCCLTGLRFCDVIRLKWGNIRNGILDIVQKKTKERLTIKLHRDAILLMGKPLKTYDYIFDLPTHTGCLKHLKKWVNDAGINKNITWHCSRHSFATALILKNEHITTVSKLLGHKSLSETETYVRVAEMTKLNAIENLPSIFNS